MSDGGPDGGSGRRRASGRPSRWLLAVAVVAIGLTLRSPIAALPPVLADVRADLDLSEATAGLLTALPVLCFAIGSTLVVLLARRFRVNALVLVSLLVLAAAVLVRPWGGAGVLLTGTIVMGLAMTVGNVLVPVIVRRDLADRTGPMMAASTSSMNVGAAITAAATAPLALLLGWRGANAAWALLALVAAGVWLLAARSTAPDPTVGRRSGVGARVWRTPDAWWLGGYFGLQSGHYYAMTTWLPTILGETADLATSTAAVGMSVFQLSSLLGTLTAPLLATRGRSGVPLAVGIAALSTVLPLGILLAPSGWLVWCLIGGVAQGAAVAFAFTVIALRAHDATAAGPLSAMTQTVGYTIGAAAPVLVGLVAGATVGWTAALLVVVAGSVLMGITGLRAGSRRTIGGSPAP